MASLSAEYDVAVVHRTLRALVPSAQLMGTTSCRGAMTEAGFHSANMRGLGLFGVIDDGAYGVGARPCGSDPRDAARGAIRDALAHANRTGELPDLVYMSSAPGCEEQLLLGVEDVVGRVPIVGGSSADSTVAGLWKQFANDGLFTDAVVVVAMFPSAEISYAFHSGYSPTERTGRVTKAKGRTLEAIDGRPAAVVYDEWIGGLLRDVLGRDANILDRTNLHPLGRAVGSAGGLSTYRLSHPERVTSENHMTLFSTIEEGERITLMAGSPESLISRPSRVAALALSDTHPDRVAGALVIYCAGCMLTVSDRMPEVVSSLGDVLRGKPFLGSFTFGEQGCFMGGENRHGNLMMSVVVFSERDATRGPG
jgi:hypothetical protein